MPSMKILLRLARRLEAAWPRVQAASESNVEIALQHLAESQDAVKCARERLAKAEGKSMTLIRPQLRQTLVRRLRGMQAAIAHALDCLEPPEMVPLTLGHWIAELRQVEQEFGDLQINWSERIVKVTTGPITLDDVDLGPFAIELRWDRVRFRMPDAGIRVVALDPNPASSDDRVTHPHVKSGTLCAGDATGPLQAALEQGRLADAFLLIRGVLLNYNEASPFVPLDEWNARECRDCYRALRSGHYLSCLGCHEDYCDGCIGQCSVCEDCRCADCLDTCDVCISACCSRCLRTVIPLSRKCCPACLIACAGCGTVIAKDPRNDGGQQCRTCQLAIPSATPFPLENHCATTLDPTASTQGG